MSKSKKRGWFRSADEDHDQDEPGTPLPEEAAPAAAAGAPEPARPPAPTGATDMTIDMAAVLDAAGIPRDDRDRVARARSLLQALPNGVSAAVRRQIVEAALTTFGVATDRIVDAARREGAALEGFVASNQQATDKLLEEARARVHALEQEILRVRQAAEQATAAHEQRIRAARAEVAAVKQVVDFFSGGPAPSAAASATSAEVELDEPTEDRSDWSVQVPVPPPTRLGRESATRPPPVPAGDAAAKPHG